MVDNSSENDDRNVVSLVQTWFWASFTFQVHSNSFQARATRDLDSVSDNVRCVKAIKFSQESSERISLLSRGSRWRNNLFIFLLSPLLVRFLVIYFELHSVKKILRIFWILLLHHFENCFYVSFSFLMRASLSLNFHINTQMFLQHKCSAKHSTFLSNNHMELDGKVLTRLNFFLGKVVSSFFFRLSDVHVKVGGQFPLLKNLLLGHVKLA